MQLLTRIMMMMMMVVMMMMKMMVMVMMMVMMMMMMMMMVRLSIARNVLERCSCVQVQRFKESKTASEKCMAV